jgi:hypothetical protein
VGTAPDPEIEFVVAREPDYSHDIASVSRPNDDAREWRAAQLQERLAIGELYDHDPKQDLVFTRVGGGPIHPDLLSQTFDRRVAKMPLPRIRLHDLRVRHEALWHRAG